MISGYILDSKTDNNIFDKVFFIEKPFENEKLLDLAKNAIKS